MHLVLPRTFYPRDRTSLVILREKRLYNCCWWIRVNFESAGGLCVLNFRHGWTLKVLGVRGFLILDSGRHWKCRGAWVLNFRFGPTLKVPGVRGFLILDTGEHWKSAGACNFHFRHGTLWFSDVPTQFFVVSDVFGGSSENTSESADVDGHPSE